MPISGGWPAIGKGKMIVAQETYTFPPPPSHPSGSSLCQARSLQLRSRNNGERVSSRTPGQLEQDEPVQCVRAIVSVKDAEQTPMPSFRFFSLKEEEDSRAAQQG